MLVDAETDGTPVSDSGGSLLLQPGGGRWERGSVRSDGSGGSTTTLERWEYTQARIVGCDHSAWIWWGDLGFDSAMMMRPARAG